MTIDKNIQIRNIYYMLSYAFQQLRQNNFEDIAGEEFEEIQDLFAEILSKGISYQLKQGLRKEYIGKHDSLTTLRGKLDINGTVRNYIQRKQILDCDYDILSENNILNQILKTTVQFLIAQKGVKPPRKAQLRKLMLFFSEVETIPVKCINWSTLRFDRNTKNYQMLMNICNFVLDGMLMTTESGQYRMKDFSDEHMCRLYEKFILEFYKRHFPELNPQAAQIGWNVDPTAPFCELLPIMQTDIMLQYNGRTLIIDAKYYSKSLQNNMGKYSVHSQNLYQIYAYVNNCDKGHTGKVDGMLLYAKTDEEITPDGEQRFSDENTIYFRTLDLNQEFAEIKKSLSGIAGIIKETDGSKPL